MKKTNLKVFPKVFKTGERHDVFISIKPCQGQAEQAIFVKIQPMETYGIQHSANYRIDEEERYPYYPAKNVGAGSEQSVPATSQFLEASVQVNSPK